MILVKILNLANLLLLISIMYKRFPPKEINDLYGYRTARSKSSQEAWDEGNRMSADFMMKLSLVSVLIYNPLLFFAYSQNVFVIGMIVITVVLIVGHIVIERKLRRMFDEEGRRID